MRGFMPSNEEQHVVDILRRPWQRSLVFTRGAECGLSAICRRRWWRTGAGALVMSSQTLSWALVGKGKAQEEGRRECTRDWGAFKGAPLPGGVPAALPAPDRNGQDFEHEISPGVSSSAMMQDCVPSHAQDFVCLHRFCSSATGTHPQ